MTKTPLIYQLKITLLNLRQPVWRRIQIVSEGSTFWDLHVAIQCAMGWHDCHLHMFRIGKRSEVIINGNPSDTVFAYHEKTFNGWETNISQYLRAPGDVALYEYDMGDGWMHEILLEGILLKEKGVKYPICLDGACACPPEDCGGAPGFEHLLKVLASPRHPEYADTISWLGKTYDAAYFDRNTVKFANPVTRWKHWLKMTQE